MIAATVVTFGKLDRYLNFILRGNKLAHSSLRATPSCSHGATTLSIKTLSIKTFSIKTLSIMTFSTIINKTQNSA